MPTILVRSIVFFVFMVCAIPTTNAQDEQNPTGKILEIHSGRQPMPSVIPLYREHNYGFWASGFPRLKDWKVPSSGDPVQAMDFRARLISDKAEMTISLFSGKRFGENVEVVARVWISEGQTIEVMELKKFGFEPVTVKMLATPTVVADVPLVTNPASQLRTTVSNVVATLPTFNIKFLNGSPKDIMAFEWHTETGGRPLASSIAQGKYGKALIEANGSYEMNIPASKRETDLGPIQMVIGAVIYSDGSIEGSTRSASSFLSFTEGRRKAVEEISALLEKAVERKAGRDDLSSLILRVDSLDDSLPRANGRPTSAVGIAFAAVVTEAVGFLRRADTDFAGKSEAEFISALSDLARFYSEWHNRMKVIR
ncbi:MAG: hypothetical protein QM785_17000 [Pyrinomonadaceae bacterium]